MNVVFYEMNDNIKKIGKNLQNPLNKVLYIKKPCDLLKPILILSFNPLTLNKNYLFMLDRYFFIDDVEILHNNLFKVYCNVDVLKTYENYIKSLYANIVISENPNDDFIDTTMSEKETLLEYNLTDVFDNKGKIYMTTVYKEVN